MSVPKILAFAGSLRKESYNKKLVKIAAAGAKNAGADVSVIDLRDFPLPIFDEDMETKDGQPENAKRLKELMMAHDGFLISSPEYNSSITAVLKNTIDWVSRSKPPEAPLSAFRDKVVSLMSASPGALGGLRGLVHIRAILGNIGVIVLPGQVAVARVSEAFNPDGTLKEAKQQKAVENLGVELVNVLNKLKS